MQQTGVLAALVAISLFLAVLAWKVRLIHRDTYFIASIVQRNFEQAAAEAQTEQKADERGQAAAPIGFGVQLRERER